MLVLSKYRCCTIPVLRKPCSIYSYSYSYDQFRLVDNIGNKREVLSNLGPNGFIFNDRLARCYICIDSEPIFLKAKVMPRPYITLGGEREAICSNNGDFSSINHKYFSRWDALL